jgi:hypothetical protein
LFSLNPQKWTEFIDKVGKDTVIPARMYYPNLTQNFPRPSHNKASMINWFCASFAKLLRAKWKTEATYFFDDSPKSLVPETDLIKIW